MSSSFSKILLVALTALSAVAASAHAGADHPGFKARSVIASHEAAPSLSTVAQHPVHRHRHHHRKHRMHAVRHGR